MILIVDDSSDTAQLLARLLSQRGLESVVMPGGEELFGYLQSHTRCDLIILDMMMPEMDGLECLRAIRKKPEWQQIPVAIYSADSTPTRIAAARKLGAKEYVVKASSWDEFLGTIQKYASNTTQQTKGLCEAPVIPSESLPSQRNQKGN